MRLSLLLAMALVSCLLLPLAITFADDKPTEPVPKGSDASDLPGPSEKDRARVKELVSELSKITAEIRGLEWKRPVEADLLTRDQMKVKMRTLIKEQVDANELERDTRILRRLGMMAEDEDPLQIALEMVTSMAGGFYDPEEKKLYLLAGQAPDAQKPTIVHELLHALEDQYMDLGKREKELKDNSDGMFAFKCILEGSAEQARLIYEERNPDDARAQVAGMAQNARLMEGQRRTLARTPAFLMLDTLLHYRTGPNFVKHALKGPYAENMDAIYASSPSTQEQVLHPERWLGKQRDLPQKIVWAPTLVEALGDGWSSLRDQTVGELDLALWIDFFLGPDNGKLSMRDMQSGTYVAPEARRAAEGWDGGRRLFLSDGDNRLVVASALVFDSTEDAQEAYAAIKSLLAAMHGDAWQRGSEEGADTKAVTLQYAGHHGAGRLARRGAALLWLDGAKDGELDAVWSKLEATRFEKAEDDTYTPRAFFDGCEVVRRDLGIGWDVPDGWTLNEQASKSMRSVDPGFVAQLSRTVSTEDGKPLGAVQVMFQTAAQGMSSGVIPEVMKANFGAHMPFAESRLKSLTLAGNKGYSYDMLPAQTPVVMRAIMTSDGIRSFITIVRGPRAAVGAIAEDLHALFEGIRERHVY